MHAHTHTQCSLVRFPLYAPRIPISGLSQGLGIQHLFCASSTEWWTAWINTIFSPLYPQASLAHSKDRMNMDEWMTWLCLRRKEVARWIRKLCVILLDIWILDLEIFGGSTGPFLEQEPPLKSTEVERWSNCLTRRTRTSVQLSPDKERPASLQSPRDPQNICHPSSPSSEGCASQPIRNANPQCGAGLTDPVGGSESSSNLY